MNIDPDTLLEAESDELEGLLAGVDLREWLHVALAHQLDYQTKMESPGSFSLDHPALALEQYARLRALGLLGPEAMPEILGVLVHPETRGSNPVVWSMCDALVRMGKNGQEASGPLLQRLMSDGVTEYPSRVLGALLAVSDDLDSVRKTVETGLDSEDESQILTALYALPALQAVETAPRVLALSHSTSAEVRSQAALALGSLAVGDAASERRLLQLTSDPEWFVRGNAIDSLGAMGAIGDEVRQAALRILEEPDDTPDWSAPEGAARTLRLLGGSVDALRARLLRPELSPGLAEELIAALQDAGATGWEDQVREEFGYLFEAEDDDE